MRAKFRHMRAKIRLNLDMRAKFRYMRAKFRYMRAKF